MESKVLDFSAYGDTPDWTKATHYRLEFCIEC